MATETVPVEQVVVLVREAAELATKIRGLCHHTLPVIENEEGRDAILSSVLALVAQIGWLCDKAVVHLGSDDPVNSADAADWLVPAFFGTTAPRAG